MPSGIITKGIGGFYYVSSGDAEYECRARGRFRREEITPLPGDRVNFSIVDGTRKTGFIEEILPRDMVLTRPAVANVNQLVAVISASSPDPDFLLLDKLLVTADKKGLKVVLCINKIDLEPAGNYKKTVSAYGLAEYRVVETSGRTGEGFQELLDSLKGRISVFAGQSGVGKSTILNKLLRKNVMETGEISRKAGRGKHTTRHAELVRLEEGGYLADTPGFSSFELCDITPPELQLHYPEFAAYLGSCRFTGCSHVSEPDCGVKRALEEGRIAAERYERYRTLYGLLKENRIYGNK